MWGRLGVISLSVGCAFHHGDVPGGDGGNPPPADARRDAPIDAATDGRSPPPPPPDAPPDAPPAPATCPQTYNLHDSARPNSHYRSVTASTDWAMAEASCEADSAISHLIVLDDAAERTWAFQQNNSDQWVGITDINLEGTWIPVTNQTFWDEGTASGNMQNKDCLYLNSTDTFAESCGGGHPYLCECDGRAADPTKF